MRANKYNILFGAMHSSKNIYLKKKKKHNFKLSFCGAIKDDVDNKLQYTITVTHG